MSDDLNLVCRLTEELCREAERVERAVGAQYGLERAHTRCLVLEAMVSAVVGYIAMSAASRDAALKLMDEAMRLLEHRGENMYRIFALSEATRARR